MAAQTGLFLILMVLAKAVDSEVPARWIVWNVGQGQWVTRVEDGVCRHFDMGGERAPWSEVMALCRTRKNYVLLSHWDSDHIGFVGKAGYFLPNLCREKLPGGAPSEKKRRMVQRVAECDRRERTPFAVWRPPEVAGKAGPPGRGHKSNEASAIVAWRSMLIAGDSTKAMEKIWAFELRGLDAVKILIAGHHGSRTSTSSVLLDRMPQLKLAIASARRRRYGHPHRETLEILQKYKTPILTTEDWGHIHVW